MSHLLKNNPFNSSNALIDNSINEPIIIKKEKMACCQSYFLPRGRCYSCTESDTKEQEEERTTENMEQ
jgi:hypothetical protein